MLAVNEVVQKFLARKFINAFARAFHWFLLWHIFSHFTHSHSYFIGFHFNIIQPSIFRSSDWPVSAGFLSPCVEFRNMLVFTVRS
jgi:hypothetical protein